VDGIVVNNWMDGFPT